MPLFQCTRRFVVGSKRDNGEVSCRLAQRTIKLKIDVIITEAISADDQNALGAAEWSEHVACALR